MPKSIRIGSGAGFSGDRIEPALELVEHGALDYLAFECLAERTIALAQAARQADPDAGYDPLLETRMRLVLPAAWARRVRIVTNMGAGGLPGGVIFFEVLALPLAGFSTTGSNVAAAASMPLKRRSTCATRLPNRAAFTRRLAMGWPLSAWMR